MSSFSISSASGRRVNLLNPVDVDPHEIIRVSSLTRMSTSLSPPPVHPAHDSSLSPGEANMPEPGQTTPAPGKRIYRCVECQKVFSTSGHLTRHSKVHTGEKNHICPYPDCQRRCSRRDNLLQHYTMHLTKEERDLPTTYVREALAAMQAKMGTYVHPYPRGSAPAMPTSPTSAMHVERNVPQHAQTSPAGYSPSSRYPEPANYTRPGQSPQRSFPVTSSPEPLKRPLELGSDDSQRPANTRRTSSASSSSTMGPITPPMPLAASIKRKEYVPEQPEDHRYQVSSVRGTL